MEEIESINYGSNNENFIIKLYKTQDGFNVISFKDDLRVSPNYGVSKITANDFELYYESKGYIALINLAKSDIDNGLIRKN